MRLTFNGLACLLLISLAPAFAADKKAAKAIRLGDKVPDFSVERLDGSKQKLSQLRKDKRLSGQGVTMLTFWCSFCDSCRDIDKPLQNLAKTYRGKCLVLAVDASYGETTKQVREFFRENKLRLPVVLDEYGKSADIFGVTMTTTTVVIDAQGRLRYIGRLKDGDKTPAEDALKAVLAGTDVLVQSTKPRG